MCHSNLNQNTISLNSAIYDYVQKTKMAAPARNDITQESLVSDIKLLKLLLKCYWDTGFYYVAGALHFIRIRYLFSLRNSNYSLSLNIPHYKLCRKMPCLHNDTCDCLHVCPHLTRQMDGSISMLLEIVIYNDQP